MAPLQVVIVGGGLSGACLANGLVNRADEGLVDVTIYERDTESDRRQGYQIRLGAHALVGFRACLTPRQYADCLRCFGRSGGVVSSAPAIFNPNMDLVLDLSKFPAYQKSAPVGRARLRNFLQAPLRKRGVVRYGMKFTGFDVVDDSSTADSGEEGNSSRIRVYFEDGSSQDCDVLVSAEGSGSRTNKQMGLNNIIEEEPKAGEGGLLGKCHLPWNVLRGLPQPLIEKGTIYASSSNAKIFAAAYLPDNLRPSARAKASQSGLNEAGTKPSDYDEDQASLFVATAWNDGPSAAEVSRLPGLQKKRLMRDMLEASGFTPGYLKLVEALDPEEIQATPWRQSKEDTPVDWRDRLLSAAAAASKDGPSDPRVAHPRVWLIGDSIHAMLPYRGMGANQAIHDTADALGPLLELARKKKAEGRVTDAQVLRQLAVYENAMMPRAFAWVKQSAAQGISEPPASWVLYVYERNEKSTANNVDHSYRIWTVSRGK